MKQHCASRRQNFSTASSRRCTLAVWYVYRDARTRKLCFYDIALPAGGQLGIRNDD
jgi:hypothetical protein